MKTRKPILLPVAREAVPPDSREEFRYRYWGNQKPPKNALILCQATPRLSADATKATIRLYGPIDPYGGFWGTSAKEVAEALDGLDDTVTDLQLRINSPGGDCFEGLAILNLLRAHPANVTAVVDGIAASAASFIAAGCDDTVMSPGTTLMVHGPSGLCWGTAADMREVADVLDKISASMASIYAEAAGGTTADWVKVQQTDTWYTAEEAVEAGLADKVAVVPDAGQTTTAGTPEEPIEVVIVEDDEDDATAALTRRYAAIYTASAHRSTPTAPAGGPITTQEGSPAVAFSDEQVTNMRQTLGLPESADEATILAALDEALTERADTPADTDTPVVPEGMALVDAEVLAELREGMAAGRTAQAELTAQARDRAITAAIAAGKTTPARRDHWVKAWTADPVGTEALLDSLEPGLVVPTAEIGNSANAEDAELDTTTAAELDAYGASLGLPKGALTNG